MKVMLLGAGGQLGCELNRKLTHDFSVIEFSHAKLDIKDHNAVFKAVNLIKPQVIVNCAAYTAVDLAENNIYEAYEINSASVKRLAKIANDMNSALIHYSTDYVFDGKKNSPYVETDCPEPLNIYGLSKLAGERAISSILDRHLIFRTTWIIGVDGENFAKKILRLATKENKINVISDQRGVPTATSLIARVTIDALRAFKVRKEWPSGVYHLTPRGDTNWHEIAKILIEFAQGKGMPMKLNANQIFPVASLQYSQAANRPMNSLLDTTKLKSQLSFELPHWKDDFLFLADQIISEMQI